jgi:hypothetical protein
MLESFQFRQAQIDLLEELPPSQFTLVKKLIDPRFAQTQTPDGHRGWNQWPVISNSRSEPFNLTPQQLSL